MRAMKERERDSCIIELVIPLSLYIIIILSSVPSFLFLLLNFFSITFYYSIFIFCIMIYFFLFLLSLLSFLFISFLCSLPFLSFLPLLSVLFPISSCVELDTALPLYQTTLSSYTTFCTSSYISYTINITLTHLHIHTITLDQPLHIQFHFFISLQHIHIHHTQLCCIYFFSSFIYTLYTNKHSTLTYSMLRLPSFHMTLLTLSYYNIFYSFYTM